VKVFGLLSLLIAVGTVVVLVSLQVKSLSLVGGNKSENPTTAASSVKSQADLKALAVRLHVYYAENGSYPTDINAVDLTGLEGNTYKYTFCDPASAIIRSGNEVLVINDVGESFAEEATC